VKGMLPKNKLAARQLVTDTAPAHFVGAP